MGASAGKRRAQRRLFAFESLEVRLVLSGSGVALELADLGALSPGALIHRNPGSNGSQATLGFQDAIAPENFSVSNELWPSTAGFGSLTVITYSYSNLFDGQVTGIGASDLRRATEESMRLWATYAPLHFVEVVDSGPLPTASDGDYGAAGRPQIRFGHHPVDGTFGVLAHAYFPGLSGIAGDVHFDDGELWSLNPNGAGIDFLEVCAHELGHALGLGHEFNVTANMNPIYAGFFNGLGTAFLHQDDIDGIQTAYGSGRGAVVRLSDVPAVLSTAISGPTSEAGTSSTFSVTLSIQPTSTVTVDLASSRPSEGSLGVQQLVFTPENWDVPQVVSVNGVDDSIDDGDQSYAITFSPAVSFDAKFNGRRGADVAVVNVNDDVAGVNLAPSAGLTTTESGGTAVFQVSLRSQPLANVTIPLASSDPTEGTASLTAVTFTPGNWNAPQSVTLTGANDNLSDGDVAYSIVTGAALSSDLKYVGLNPADVSALNVDDDPYVRVQAAAGLTTTESGGKATFGIVLNSPPTANVTIGLASNLTGEGIPSPNALVFTALNWNVPQPVEVTGQDDFRVDGDVAYAIITANATSADASYNNLPVADVNLVNVDDDASGFIVTPLSGLQTTESGGQASFTVRLTSQPSQDVYVAYLSGDETEGQLETTGAEFRPDNWDVPQTFTVTGLPDGVPDGAVAYVLLGQPTVSDDPEYSGLVPSDVAATNYEVATIAGRAFNDTNGNGLIDGGESGLAGWSIYLDLNDDGLLNPSETSVATDGSGNYKFDSLLTGTYRVRASLQAGFRQTAPLSYTPALAFRQNLSVGAQPVELATGDWDGDPWPDLAVAVGGSSSITILKGGADGLFSGAGSIGLPAAPTALATLDFDRDGDADLAVATNTANGVQLLRNDAGAFSIIGLFAVGTNPLAIVAGDWNGDSFADLAVANSGSGDVTILLNSQSGGFNSQTVAVGGNPVALAAIDIDRNGRSDLAVATGTGNNIALLMNTNGAFAKTTDVAVAGGPSKIAVGDLNGDLFADLAVVTPTSSSVALLLNDHAGSFTPGAAQSALPGVPVAVQIADVDRDGDPDLAITTGAKSTDTGRVAYRVNRGAGTFDPGGSTLLGAGKIAALTTIAVDGDHDVDFVAINQTSGRIALLQNLTTPAFSYQLTVAGGQDFQNIHFGEKQVGVIVTAGSLVTTEAGGAANFTLKLASQPSANVTIPLASSDLTEGTVAPLSLVFTSANWNIEQTVTVTGVDDSLVDGAIPYSVILGVAASTDASYSGLNPADVAIVNNDNESGDLIVSNISDSGPGSLRAAMLQANVSAGSADVIRFQIPGAGAKTIQLTSPLPSLSDPATFDVGVGNSVTLAASGATLGDFAALTIQGGTLRIGGSQTHAAAATLVALDSDVRLDGDGGGNLTLRAVGAGRFALAADQHLSGMILENGGRAAILGDNRGVITKLLVIDAAHGSQFDLGRGALAIDYSSGASPIAAVTAQLRLGFNLSGVVWDGPGMNSSAARDDSAGLASVGVVDNATIGYDSLDGAHFGFGLPGATALPAQSVLVKFTYGGDTDLNGLVDGDDLTSFLVGYSNQGESWGLGDFDYSQAVDGDDLTTLLVSYANQGAPLASAVGVSAGSLGPPADAAANDAALAQWDPDALDSAAPLDWVAGENAARRRRSSWFLA